MELAASGAVPARGPGSPDYLRAQRADLLRFCARSRNPLGFGWLDDAGVLDEGVPTQLWITCRMTHVVALGALVGETPAVGGPDIVRLRDLTAHGIESLSTTFVDQEHGGWFTSIGSDGPVDAQKSAYAHSFVILAASSAAAAGIEGAPALLEQALDTSVRRFWGDEHGMVVDTWDRDWTQLDPYRGINANMHTVEAYLAAVDVTGDVVWLERALRIARRLRDSAEAGDWRIPEHFDESWTPIPDYNLETPADPFRPYGATIGHGLEWARLLVAAEATAAAHGRGDLLAGLDLTADAVQLTDRAIADGWAVDGADGFVYTTDWDGAPVVRNRMHWVLAEALNTGWVLDEVLGSQRYADRLAQWWAYADRYVVDGVNGSWHSELDPTNRPTASTWSGKPDVYHAYQTALIPTLPVTPVLSVALAGRREL